MTYIIYIYAEVKECIEWPQGSIDQTEPFTEKGCQCRDNQVCKSVTSFKQLQTILSGWRQFKMELQ